MMKKLSEQIIRRACKGAFILIGLLGFVSSAFAALDLELTKGVHAPIPIAVLPFALDNQPPSTQVDQVVNMDLQNSGRFLVANNQTFTQTPNDPSQVNFTYWQQFRLNAMVMGQVKTIAPNQYQVTFFLVNLFKSVAPQTPAGSSMPASSATSGVAPTSAATNISNIPASAAVATSAQNPVLATQTFTVSGNGLRHVGHQIADIVYQQLTGEPGIFTTQIAYVLSQPAIGHQSANYALDVADYDGYDVKTLLNSKDPVMSPAWSPDGQNLAFVSFDQKGYPAVYAMNVTTGQKHILSAATGLNAAPAFSPDGKQLAMVLSKTGTPKIYLLDLASKTLAPVTSGWGADTEPAWYPDGSKLAFTSNRGGSPQIYQIDLTSKTVTPLTTAGSYNTNSAISADGTTMVMLHGDDTAYNVASQDLTNGQTALITNTGLVSSETFAPNSNLVMYSTLSGGHEILAVTSVDGSTNYALPVNASGNMKEPTWGPIKP